MALSAGKRRNSRQIPKPPPNAPRPRNRRPPRALTRTARAAMRMPCASCDALPRYWRPAIPRWRSVFARGTRDAPCPVRGNGRRLCPAEKQRKEIPLGLPGPAIEVGREPIPPKTKGGGPCGPPPSGCALQRKAPRRSPRYRTAGKAIRLGPRRAER